MEITILGTRGSVPVSGDEYKIFGGNTTCVRVLTNEAEVYLDAGTGIALAPVKNDRPLAVLISHPHLDHVIGLPFFAALSDPEREIKIYGAAGIEDCMERLFSPPFWPLTVKEYPAHVDYIDICGSFCVGDIEIETMEGEHPGGSLIFKLSCNGNSFVFATDYESGRDTDGKLIDFAEGAKLLIIDAQYTNKEYESRRGFGHSTPDCGMRISERAGIDRVIFTHHAPEHTDDFLKSMEDSLDVSKIKAGFARANETIIL